MSETPREVIIVSESRTVDFSLYPWLKRIRVNVKAASAGTDKPGKPGYVILELFD